MSDDNYGCENGCSILLSAGPALLAAVILAALFGVECGLLWIGGLALVMILWLLYDAIIGSS